MKDADMFEFRGGKMRGTMFERVVYRLVGLPVLINRVSQNTMI